MVLAALPLGLWLESARHPFLLWAIAAPLAGFLMVGGYRGARAILGTPQ